MTAAEPFRPRLRPLSVGEILDVSIKICVAHWRTLLKTVLVVVVPVQILSTLLTADYTVTQFDLTTDTTQTPQQSLDELNQYIGGLAVTTLLQMAAVLLASAACFRAVAQSYLGEESDWRSSLRFALRNAPSLLWLTLLYGLGVLLGTVLLIAPGVWLFIGWAFAMPALLAEGVRGRKALGRSWGLVKGRWWRTFGVVALGFVLAGITSSVVQGLFFIGILFNHDNDVLVLVLSAIAGVVGLLITTPFQSALLAVVYFDLRVRKEGFDLELLARGIGAGVVPQPDRPDELWPQPADGAGGGPDTNVGAGARAAWPEPRADGAAPWPEPHADGPAAWPEPRADGPAPWPGAHADGPAPSPEPRADGPAPWPGAPDPDPDDEPPRLPGVPSG
ncbi:MAG: hypothetical protein QOE31_2055 [Solirubrobacteraceae bacterium]|nr:hypothetical protein [Solirubrobacteraceae bacterium]